MEQDRNVIQGIIAAIVSGAVNIPQPMEYMIYLGLVLIFTDFRFGWRASKHKGEDVRVSRAIRRTFNKIIDYTCWLSLSILIGSSFGHIPIMKYFPYIIIGVIYFTELNSCFSNYYAAKGLDVKINLLNFFKKKGLNIFEDKDCGSCDKKKCDGSV